MTLANTQDLNPISTSSIRPGDQRSTNVESQNTPRVDIVAASQAINDDDEKTVSPSSQNMTQSGDKWSGSDVQTIPHNNLWVVFPGLMLVVFLAALDQTIIGTALPIIVRDLGTAEGYSWVGSGFFIAASCFQPLWGKLSDLAGRKPLLYFGITVFMAGSALCGAAQSMVWLICARAVQGVGAGAITAMIQVIMGDIVSLEDRGKFSGIIGGTWGIASMLGPPLGGLLTDKVSWRWTFYINLPTGGLAAIILLKLNLNPVPRRSIKSCIDEFDFLGLFLLMSGVLALLLGFTFGEKNWSAPATIGLLVSSAILLIGATINEIYTTRSPIIPPRLFTTRTTTIVVISVFIHAFSFFAGTFYLPLYYQIRGSSALRSGLEMMPYALTAAVTSVLSGQVVGRTASYRPTTWVAWAVMAIGFGLMIDLEESSSIAKRIVYPLIAAAGIGCLFQTPLIAIQAAMPLRDMATSTVAVGLVRQIGGAIGVSAGGALYISDLRNRLDKIPAFTADDGKSDGELINDVSGLIRIEPPELRQAVLSAYTKSVSRIWLMCTPMVAAGFIMVLFLRHYSLKRPTNRTPKDKDEANPVSQGRVSSTETHDIQTRVGPDQDLENGRIQPTTDVKKDSASVQLV